jgi:heme/copper-type cytochrome/quinol oxidase subunit 3
MARPPGERLFFGLYYGMTGLHGLHVTVGIVVMAIMLTLFAATRFATTISSSWKTRACTGTSST